MAEEWIVRVQGKEYGPVDIETLREWRDEGRLLPPNQARRADVDLWTTAAEIPGLFESVDDLEGRTFDVSLPRRSFAQILTETLRIYRKGFFQFFYLTLLVALPSICAQLSGSALGVSPEMNADLRTLIAAMFTFCMLLLSLAAWPTFIAGIQIVAAEIAAGGRKARIFALFREVLKFWPRVALLDGASAGNHLDDHERASFLAVDLARARCSCLSGLDRRTVVRQLPLLAAIRCSCRIGRRRRITPK